jgi:serine/threonine-protein kinase HipA
MGPRSQAPTGRSLPGAQVKTAYYYDSLADRWGVPGGRTPTTHIVKPCIPGLDGLVESQAMGLMPSRKYQEDGGPSITQIVHLLRRCHAPDIDIERFLRANIFNWLIGGTDAHAKNYSLLITAGDRVQLAPLYDLSSQLPYPDMIAQPLAMKIGEHYDLALVDAADWRQLARTCALEEDHVLTVIREMAQVMPDHISAARARAIKDGLSADVIDPLAQLLTRRSRACLGKITSPGSSGRRRRNARHASQ